jgi:hypothetical protein
MDKSLPLEFHLVEALIAMDSVREHLRTGSDCASNVQTILLTDLLAKANALQREIRHLQVAVEGDCQVMIRKA